jgi:ribosomal protein S18 acetylase RimI-like enzyme
VQVIRTAQKDDAEKLEALYKKTVYGKTPSLVRWALETIPERVLVAERHEGIVGAVYTCVCGYNHLWSSYFIFKTLPVAEALINHLMRIRDERGYRNLYVFCPKDFTELRVRLIVRGFIPECLRKLDGIDYVVESYDGSFKPNYKLTPSPKRKLSMKIRKGGEENTKPLAKILRECLPEDFEKFQDAERCVRRWLKEPEYVIVAEHKGSPIGILLSSSEILPVTDEKTGWLCYIAVKEKHRRRGVGTALVEEACKTLPKERKSSMDVDVDAHDPKARIFYTKNRFYPFWFSKGYMPDNDGIFHRKDFTGKHINSKAANCKSQS